MWHCRSYGEFFYVDARWFDRFVPVTADWIARNCAYNNDSYPPGGNDRSNDIGNLLEFCCPEDPSIKRENRNLDRKDGGAIEIFVCKPTLYDHRMIKMSKFKVVDAGGSRHTFNRSEMLARGTDARCRRFPKCTTAKSHELPSGRYPMRRFTLTSNSKTPQRENLPCVKIKPPMG